MLSSMRWRALRRGKVLSTPVIQTMDNQEANIVVGESVPVPVSTVSSLVGGVGTLTTGQLNANIEYKDVAIELKVTPRINPDGYVRMDIEQKVNDLGAHVQHQWHDSADHSQARSEIVGRGSRSKHHCSGRFDQGKQNA